MRNCSPLAVRAIAQKDSENLEEWMTMPWMRLEGIDGVYQRGQEGLVVTFRGSPRRLEEAAQWQWATKEEAGRNSRNQGRCERLSEKLCALHTVRFISVLLPVLYADPDIVPLFNDEPIHILRLFYFSAIRDGCPNCVDLVRERACVSTRARLRSLECETHRLPVFSQFPFLLPRRRVRRGHRSRTLRLRRTITCGRCSSSCSAALSGALMFESTLLSIATVPVSVVEADSVSLCG